MFISYDGISYENEFQMCVANMSYFKRLYDTYEKLNVDSKLLSYIYKLYSIYKMKVLDSLRDIYKYSNMMPSIHMYGLDENDFTKHIESDVELNVAQEELDNLSMTF